MTGTSGTTTSSRITTGTSGTTTSSRIMTGTTGITISSRITIGTTGIITTIITGGTTEINQVFFLLSC